MREVILPLAVIALVLTAIVARRVLRPFLSNSIALGAALSVVAYAALEIAPRVRQLSFFQPLRVQLEPPATFGALSDGRPSEIAVQVYRGDRLLEERRIPALGEPVEAPPGQPLRLERLASGTGYRVLAGTTPLGELSSEAVAKAGLGTQPDPDEPLPQVAEGPAPDPVPEIDPALGATDGLAAADLPQAAEIPSEPIETTPAEPSSEKSAPARPPPVKRPSAVKKAPARAQLSAADREVELRARASQLSRRGDACGAGRLLREQGREERTVALARELEARCRWGPRDQ
jgi:hypothetical protein